jgi:hypothetical protein
MRMSWERVGYLLGYFGLMGVAALALVVQILTGHA